MFLSVAEIEPGCESDGNGSQALGNLEDMPYEEPLYSRSRVDRAGRRLAAPGALLDEDIARVIGNWRAAHAYPLVHLRVNLAGWAAKRSRGSLVSQRLKRMPAISLKLHDNPHMQLSQMQDIGGCRAVVDSVAAISAIVEALKTGRAAHILSHEDDYISVPKDSGYRSYHLVYRYRNANKPAYNGLRIELQMRTRLQHAWATAVEIAGTFRGQALKSGHGSVEWLEFFKLMGADIARREQSPRVPGAPLTARQLRAEIRRLDKVLGVITHLRAWQASLQRARNIASDSFYYLIHLFPEENRLNIRGYRRDQLAEATQRYLVIEEQAIRGGALSDAVLVSVESFAELERAYPNYFIDSDRFIEAVQRAKG